MRSRRVASTAPSWMSETEQGLINVETNDLFCGYGTRISRDFRGFVRCQSTDDFGHPSGSMQNNFGDIRGK